MARLSQVQRERAVGMLLAGRSIAEVARISACTRATIYMLQRRLRQTGTTSDRPRSGRPKVTTPREDRRIRLAHQRLSATPTLGLNVLSWPVKSPDFSPIEYIWDELDRKVRKRRDVHTLDDLRNALIDEWNNLPADTVQRYM